MRKPFTNRSSWLSTVAVLFVICCECGATGPASVAVSLQDGIVMPRRGVHQAVSEAMLFLKKADGGYTPGKLEGELAGYFTSAFVREDGSRADRQLSFPGRQHAYFIFTFLQYHAYTGEWEWLLRARDLADWNISHSTPASAVYSNVPYSTFSNGKPGGSKDVDSIEPDKCAFLGRGYLAVHEATGDAKYLKAAQQVAVTLAGQQKNDGSWPFRVVPETGEIRQEFGGAPVFFVEFFEHLLRHDDQPGWRRAHDQALGLMLSRNVQRNLWGTYHEDIVLKPEGYLSAEPMSFTAAYLFRHAKEHPEYIEMGRTVLSRMENRLVHTVGHAAAPAPAVSEQAGFDHLMPGHTARYCMALAHLYGATGDERVKRTALSGINALTFMQSEAGLFRTFFHSVNPKAKKADRPNWYSQHLYTVCHVLEVMPVLPELAPESENHILGSDFFLQKANYTDEGILFATLKPSRTVLKLKLAPRIVRTRDSKLPMVDEAEDKPGWFYNEKKRLLTIRDVGGEVEVR